MEGLDIRGEVLSEAAGRCLGVGREEPERCRVVLVEQFQASRREGCSSSSPVLTPIRPAL
jgi:hypothetical protein